MDERVIYRVVSVRLQWVRSDRYLRSHGVVCVAEKQARGMIQRSTLRTATHVMMQVHVFVWLRLFKAVPCETASRLASLAWNVVADLGK